MSKGADRENENEKVRIQDLGELDLDNNSLVLIKLPKELIEFRKNGGNLKLNFAKIKSGSTFKINDHKYEGNVIKVKHSDTSAFSILCTDGGSLKKIDKFKYILEIRKSLDVPEITPPIIESKKVRVPEAIVNYVKKRSISQISDQTTPTKSSKKRKNK